jgi:hypothetical protein
MRVPFIIGTAALAAGCASSLRSFDAEGRALTGVPIRAPLLVEVTRVTTYTPAPTAGAYAAYCKPDTAVTLEVMPLGRLFYVNVDPASLGKAEFKLELTEAGTLKTVSLNSDPRTAESIKELGAALGTLLPYVAAPKEPPAEVRTTAPADASAQELRDRHCIRTGVGIRDFHEARPRP